MVAEKLRAAIEALGLEHSRSSVSNWLTISLGIASAVPDASSLPGTLVLEAGESLRHAKLAGRNQLVGAAVIAEVVYG